MRHNDKIPDPRADRGGIYQGGRGGGPRCEIVRPRSGLLLGQVTAPIVDQLAHADRPPDVEAVRFQHRPQRARRSRCKERCLHIARGETDQREDRAVTVSVGATRRSAAS